MELCRTYGAQTSSDALREITLGTSAPEEGQTKTSRTSAFLPSATADNTRHARQSCGQEERRRWLGYKC